MVADPGDDLTVDVAIIGCGLTGAALANILGAAGVRTVVFDRAPTPMDLPLAVRFDGEIMRVFQALGLTDCVAETIRLFRGAKYFSASGQLLMESKPPAVDGQHIWAEKNMFHQPDLKGVLREGADQYSSVELCLSHDVSGVADRGECVELDVREEQTGDTYSWTAAYAAGSDGGRPLFRREVGTRLEDLDAHDPWLVVDIELLGDVELPDCKVQYCDLDRPTTDVHVTGARRRWEFKVLPIDDFETLTSNANIWHLLSRWVSKYQATLVRHATYTFHALVAEKWQQGRLFLAGDSAHQTPPFLGQRLCAGVRDAANLGWKLPNVCAGSDSALLDTYERERHPHTVVFGKTAAELGTIIQTTVPEQASARDAQMIAGKAIDFRSPRPPLSAELHNNDVQVVPGGVNPLELGHIAFEMRDRSHLIDSCDRLGEANSEILWGPLRHGPGHNIATYHHTPDEQVIELYVELDRIYEEEGCCFESRPWHENRPQRPQIWDQAAANKWGQAPSAAWKR